MATATFAGNLRDFTRQIIVGARLWIHPLQPSHSGTTLMADKVIDVTVGPGGTFSVALEEGVRYRVEAVFADPERSHVGHSLLGEFRMPVGGGPAGSLLGMPRLNGSVRVLQTPPGASILDQYVYDEITGDLYERTS